MLDEFLLLINLFKNALFWILLAFVLTIPRGSQGCRTWMGLSLIGMIALSAVFQVLEVSIPDVRGLLSSSFISQMTEYELVLTISRLVPYVLMLFVMLSEYYYVNTEMVTSQMLENIFNAHQVNKSFSLMYCFVLHIYATTDAFRI